MSLFDENVFTDDGMGQVTLPEPASDALIHELATGVPSRTVEPSPSTDIAKAGGGFRPTVAVGTNRVPYALVGGGLVISGLIIWSAMKRPKPNRRRRHRRRR